MSMEPVQDPRPLADGLLPGVHEELEVRGHPGHRHRAQRRLTQHDTGDGEGVTSVGLAGDVQRASLAGGQVAGDLDAHSPPSTRSRARAAP